MRTNYAGMAGLLEAMPVSAPGREPGDDDPPTITRYEVELGIVELHGTGFRASHGGPAGVLIARVGRDGGEPVFMANSGDHREFVRAVHDHVRKGT